MPQREVTISTGDGECDASLHIPAGAGPWPGVIMYPDAASLRDVFRDMGERLAGMGYVTLVPDIYYRVGRVRSPSGSARCSAIPASGSGSGSWLSLLTRDAVSMDAQAFIGYLTALDEVTGSAVGTTGYCMGGGALAAAAGTAPRRRRRGGLVPRRKPCGTTESRQRPTCSRRRSRPRST